MTLRALSLAALLVASAAPSAAEVFLYRGDYVYVVPKQMAQAMLDLASRDSWKHFPELTRHIDVDGDGEDDFVAIALGSTQGHGGQLRFSLRYGAEEGGKPKLGSWSWAVLTDGAGATVLELFNP